MSIIIDGKKKAEQVRAEIAREVTALLAAGKPRPGLAVVLVGEDPASQVYVRNKVKQSEEVGFHSIEHRLPADASPQQVLELVQQLNQDPAVNGILVQLPLPKHIDQAPIIEAISPAKDVDGLTTVNAGLLTNGQQGLVPCTPLGCILLLRDVVPSLAGLNAVVLGRSILVGKPVASLLLAENCTVTIAHSRTRNLGEVCRAADILVAAVGRPKMVQGDWVKPGATVIDVGINRVQDGDKSRLVGDVDFDAAAKVAGAITPVPGGVGPMTIACLLANTLTAAKRQFGIR